MNVNLLRFIVNEWGVGRSVNSISHVAFEETLNEKPKAYARGRVSPSQNVSREDDVELLCYKNEVGLNLVQQ